MVTSTISQTRRFHLAPKAILTTGVIAMLATAFAIFSSRVQTARQAGPDATALAYAKQQMVWISGPSIDASYILPMSELREDLRQHAPKNLAADVNTADLIHRYGKNRQIGMVLVKGVFNTLPPDEGVVVHGDVVVIVDLKKDRPLLLTD